MNLNSSFKREKVKPFGIKPIRSSLTCIIVYDSSVRVPAAHSAAGHYRTSYFMNILIAALLSASLLILTGCGEKPPVSPPKPQTETKLPDEFTSEKQIPSVLEEALTPEEKSDIMKQIMPAQAGDSTPEEKFLQLRKDA